MDKEKSNICCSCLEGRIPIQDSESLGETKEEAKYEEILCTKCPPDFEKNPAELLLDGFPCCQECKLRINSSSSPNKPKKLLAKSPLHKASMSEIVDEDFQYETKKAKFNRGTTSFTPSMTKRTMQALSKDLTPSGEKPKILGNLSRKFSGQNLKEEDTKLPSQTGMYSPVATTVFSPNFKRSSLVKPISLIRGLLTEEVSPNDLQKKGIKDHKIYEILTTMITYGYSSIQDKILFSLSQDKTSTSFHDICDSRAPLIYLIMLHSGFTFGGFHYITLEDAKKKESLEDPLCGFFSMLGEKIYFYECNKNSITYNQEGFSFGSPRNLFIDLNIIDNSSCSLEMKYKSPLGADIKFKFGSNFVWSLMLKDIIICKL